MRVRVARGETLMTKRAWIVPAVCVCGIAIPQAAAQESAKPGGYIIQRDAEVAEPAAWPA